MPGVEIRPANLANVLLAAILWLLCWALLRDAATAPPSWFPGDIGVTAVPELAIWGLVILSGLLLLQTAWRWKEADVVEWRPGSAWQVFRERGLRMTLTLLLMVVYIASLWLETPGFEVKSFAWLTLTLLVLLGRRRWPAAVGVSLLAVALVSIVFTRIFTVTLP
mgnify:FL=1